MAIHTCKCGDPPEQCAVPALTIEAQSATLSVDIQAKCDAQHHTAVMYLDANTIVALIQDLRRVLNELTAPRV